MVNHENEKHMYEDHQTHEDMVKFMMNMDIMNLTTTVTGDTIIMGTMTTEIW